MFNNMTVGLAHIKSLFISHFDKTNQIDPAYGNSSTIFILLILLILILLSIRRRTEKSSYCRNKDVFSLETTTMIRGYRHHFSSDWALIRKVYRKHWLV